MATNLPYDKIVVVFSLYFQKYNYSEMAYQIQSSRHTVQRLLEDAESKNLLVWPITDEVRDGIRTLLMRQAPRALRDPDTGENSKYEIPDWEHVRAECKRDGVTLKLIHKDYSLACILHDKTPYSYPQFCYLFRTWGGNHKYVMRKQKKPGDVTEYDWVGNTMSYTDPENGKEHICYLYVAVLPYSLYTFCDVFENMQLGVWIDASCDTFEYFEGVTRIMRPDNLKTAVLIHKRDCVSLQKNHQDLSDHYQSAVVPAGVAKPKHKSAAENTVKIVETEIIAALRDQKFFSFESLRAAVIQAREKINDNPDTILGMSRREFYMLEEKEYMRPLPKERYVKTDWFRCKVGNDYVVRVGKNYYSVPHEYIGSEVDVALKNGKLEIYMDRKLIAVHKYVEKYSRNAFVDFEHMPESHKAVAQMNGDDLRAFAKDVGPFTTQAFEYYLTRGKVEDQGFEACSSLKHMAEKYGSSSLERACKVVQANGGTPTLDYIREYLRNELKKVNESTAHGTQGLTRGADQFE